MLTFLIVTFEPAGSIPSVLRGKTGHERIVFRPTSYLSTLEYSPKK